MTLPNVAHIAIEALSASSNDLKLHYLRKLIHAASAEIKELSKDDFFGSLTVQDIVQNGRHNVYEIAEIDYYNGTAVLTPLNDWEFKCERVVTTEAAMKLNGFRLVENAPGSYARATATRRFAYGQLTAGDFVEAPGVVGFATFVSIFDFHSSAVAEVIDENGNIYFFEPKTLRKLE